MSSHADPSPFDLDAPDRESRFRKLLLVALCCGVFENNLRLARTLSNWGGPLGEGQILAYLHRIAFGMPEPAWPEGMLSSATATPSWQKVTPLARLPIERLNEIERQAWVQRVGEDVQAMTRDLKATLERYAARPDTAQGRIVSGDTLLHMLGAVQENPVLGLAAFRYVETEALAGLPTLVSRLRDQAMDLTGSHPVALMAGGQGSGKTTVAQHLIRLGWPGAIVDSPWVTERDIRMIRNSRREAWILYVDRPFEGAFLSMVHRAADEGRMVSPCDMAQAHARIPGDLLKAAALFRNQPGVALWHLQNRAPDLSHADALGGPLHREGKDAFSSIRDRPENRCRAAFEASAASVWATVQEELHNGQRNPYPLDLAAEIERGLVGH